MNLKTIAERAVNGAPLLSELLNPERKQDLDTYLWGMEVVDFLIEHPSIKWTRQDFIDTLAKLVPRLYSISSSLKAQPDQVHFTIDVVHYESRGRMRKGVYSTFLAERAQKEKTGFSLVRSTSTATIFTKTNLSSTVATDF